MITNVYIGNERHSVFYTLQFKINLLRIVTSEQQRYMLSLTILNILKFFENSVRSSHVHVIVCLLRRGKNKGVHVFIYKKSKIQFATKSISSFLENIANLKQPFLNKQNSTQLLSRKKPLLAIALLKHFSLQ